MNSLHCLFFLLIAVALAQPGVGHDGNLEEIKAVERKVIHEVNLNKAFDKVLPNIRNYIKKYGLDPMEIPDVEIPLSHLPGLFKTKMILHKGHIEHLSTLLRTGDIILQFSKQKASLYLNIGWESVDLSHDYSLRYMLYTRKGECSGRYEDLKARILFDFDFQSRKVNLMFIKFTHVGKFELKLEGHLIDGLINVITKAVTKVFRTSILQIIEHKAYEEIEKKVQEINDLIPSPLNYAAFSEEILSKVNDDQEFIHASPYKVDGLGEI